MTSLILGEPFVMSPFPHGETVQRLAWLATTRNSHNVETYTRADPVDVEGVAFDPGASYEPADPTAARIVTQPTLYVAFNQPTHPLDQWQCRGVLYEVDGDKGAPWQSVYSSWQPGQVIKLRRVTG